MMLAQIISERQLSTRLFTSYSKYIVRLLQERLPVMPFSPRSVDLIMFG